MTDEPDATTEQTAEAGTALVTSKPPFIPVTNSVAIWDSAEFAHMGRVGRVMADSGLASDTIFKNGDEPAPEAMVVARMVMIANLARECDGNPLMFLQGCSIIGRKLHLEGKLVNAIIRKRTKVVLKFIFGAWDTDHIVFPPMIPLIGDDGEPVINEATGKPVMVADQTFFHGLGERLAVRALDPLDPERYVDGSVGLWKTDRKGSPWAPQGNWRRQLRYRAAPEWARAYEPGAVVGIYSDADEDLDEVEDAPRGRRAKRDLAGKLTGESHGGEHGAQGFDRTHVTSLGEKTDGDVIDAKTGEVLGEVIDGEFIEGGQGGGSATDVAAQGSEGAPAASEASRDAPGPSAELVERAEALAKIAPNDEDAELITARLVEGEKNGDKVEDGHAEEGEQYTLAGDILDANHRRLTYKDGARYSAVKSFGKFRCYAIHAPELEDDDETDGEGKPAGVGSFPSAAKRDEAGEAVLAAHATDAREEGVIGFRKIGKHTADISRHETHPGEGWEPVWGYVDTREVIGDGAVPQLVLDARAEGDKPAGERSGAAAAPATTAAPAAEPSNAAGAVTDAYPVGDDTPLGRMAGAVKWGASNEPRTIKGEYTTMAKTTEWAGADEADRDEVRRVIWGHVERVKAKHKDPVDHATDPTAFGIWLATQPRTRDGADAVEGTFHVLKAQPIWAQMKPAQHAAIEDRVLPFLKSARG